MPRHVFKLATRFYPTVIMYAAWKTQAELLPDLLGASVQSMSRYDGIAMDVFRIREETEVLRPKAVAYARSQEYLGLDTAIRQAIDAFRQVVGEKPNDLRAVVDAFASVYLFGLVPFYVPNLWIDDIPEAERAVIVEASERYRYLCDPIMAEFDVFVNESLAKRGFPAVAPIEAFESSDDFSWMKDGFVFAYGRPHRMAWEDFLKQEGLEQEVEKQMDEVHELRGTVAQAGIVRARACVMRSVQEGSKMKHGDAIVAPMTTPNFLPYLKLASAIVTDEGGITCHAAIVARELGLPCIIGTRRATQVLKDGDDIEVDASSGIVKVIKT